MSDKKEPRVTIEELLKGYKDGPVDSAMESFMEFVRKDLRRMRRAKKLKKLLHVVPGEWALSHLSRWYAPYRNRKYDKSFNVQDDDGNTYHISFTPYGWEPRFRRNNHLILTDGPPEVIEDRIKSMGAEQVDLTKKDASFRETDDRCMYRVVDPEILNSSIYIHINRIQHDGMLYLYHQGGFGRFPFNWSAEDISTSELKERTRYIRKRVRFKPTATIEIYNPIRKGSMLSEEYVLGFLKRLTNKTP